MERHGQVTTGELARRYRRLVVKVSGEALGSDKDSTATDHRYFSTAARNIAGLHGAGIDACVITGGGNIFRGIRSQNWDVAGDYANLAGVLGTAVNSVLLAGLLNGLGPITELMAVDRRLAFCMPYTREDARRLLDARTIVFAVDGLGVTGISTDLPSVQLAVDLGADAVIMMKHGIDGIYDRDPRIHADAAPLPLLTTTEVRKRRLAVMDDSALEAAQRHGIPIHVVSARDPDCLSRLVNGEPIGSVVLPR